ncbi:MAG TPA: rod shape-determining protein MreC [Verrucomicrobiae bacterium]|jgi:rod shape-determining protein MreC|nr:rod shape-determining protein MreC [Verrucomicrobiae bacterium]
MLKKSHYIAIVVVVLVVVALLKLPLETMGKVKLAISGLFLPLFGLAGSTHELAGEAQKELTPRRELVREIDQLRRQNQEQKIQLEQDASLWNENARLRAAESWPGQTRWRVKLARVIARDPANWWRSVELDLGARDGIRTNFPVMTSDGLVGRVQSVSATRCQVVLLGNPELRVAAIVGTNYETGIITAGSSLPQDQGMIELDLLSGNSLVHPGETVVTWGAGGVFPYGIPIGKIVDSRPKEYGLSMEARVKLAANLNALEEVWVKVP